jgi:hypothetical protein
MAESILERAAPAPSYSRTTRTRDWTDWPWVFVLPCNRVCFSFCQKRQVQQQKRSIFGFVAVIIHKRAGVFFFFSFRRTSSQEQNRPRIFRGRFPKLQSKTHLSSFVRPVRLMRGAVLRRTHTWRTALRPAYMDVKRNLRFSIATRSLLMGTINVSFYKPKSDNPG